MLRLGFVLPERSVEQTREDYDAGDFLGRDVLDPEREICDPIVTGVEGSLPGVIVRKPATIALEFRRSVHDLDSHGITGAEETCYEQCLGAGSGNAFSLPLFTKQLRRSAPRVPSRNAQRPAWSEISTKIRICSCSKLAKKR